MTEANGPKKRGRPPSQEEGRRRFNLTFRIRGDLKDQIVDRAERNGCSVSEEIEKILERERYLLEINEAKDALVRILEDRLERSKKHVDEISNNNKNIAKIMIALMSAIGDNMDKDGNVNIGKETYSNIKDLINSLKQVL